MCRAQSTKPTISSVAGPVRGLLLGNCYANDRVAEMLKTSFLIQYGACLRKSRLCIGGARRFWWVPFILTPMPSPTWVGDGFIFFHGGFEDRELAQMILRGEFNSMSKKMEEKRNNFGENGMQSLGGLTPDLECLLKSMQRLSFDSSSQDLLVLLLKTKLYV